MILSILAVVAGLGLLTIAADSAVEAAEALSLHLGVSPVIVGALIVGLGTSLPEMVVSGIAAASRDTIDLAIGNIIGSNAANLTLVLGVSALITTLWTDGRVVRREGLLVVAATGLFTIVIADNQLARWEGILLLLAMAIATMIFATSDSVPPDRIVSLERGEFTRTILAVILGLIGVLIGAQLLVTGAVDIADALGASEGLVGLTLVALGTSLPELATAISAARRRSVQLIVGNVFGSNVFNSLGVAGIVGLVGTGRLEQSVTQAAVAVFALTVVVVVFAGLKGKIGRVVAGMLLVAYVPVVVLSA